MTFVVNCQQVTVLSMTGVLTNHEDIVWGLLFKMFCLLTRRRKHNNTTTPAWKISFTLVIAVFLIEFQI